MKWIKQNIYPVIRTICDSCRRPVTSDHVSGLYKCGDHYHCGACVAALGAVEGKAA